MRLLRTTGFRAALIFSALLMVSVALILLLLYGQMARRLDAEIEDIIARDAERLGAVYARGGRAALLAVLEAQSRDPRAAIYWLADADGTKIAGNLDRLPPLIGAQTRGDYVRFSHGETLNVLAVRRALAADLFLLIGRDLAARDALADTARAALLGVGALVLLLGGLGGFLLARAQARRVESMNRTLQAFIGGDFARRLAESGAGDEFDLMAQNLNAVLARIETLVGSLREVSDNLAHDMRGPLARIRTRMEQALVPPRSAKKLAAALEASMAEADRMLAGFNALLSISRLDAGLRRDARFDLAQMLADIAALYAPLAEERGIDFVASLPDTPCMVVGNRDLLVQACANVIENAFKYARPKSGAPRVELGLRQGAAQAEISCADNGMGIAAAHRARALMRFSRLDASRTADMDSAQGSGTGLGLALVAAIMRAHGGAVTLDDSAQGGLLVRLAIPMIDARAAKA